MAPMCTEPDGDDRCGARRENGPRGAAMNAIADLAGLTSFKPWVLAAALFLPVAGMGLSRALPQALGWAALGLSFCGSAVAASWLFLLTPRGTVEVMAWLSAAVSLACSAAACVAPTSARNGHPASLPPPSPVRFLLTCALLFGAAAFTLQLLVLTLRLLYTIIDLLTIHPAEVSSTFRMGSGTIWSMALLFGSCTTALITTRERQLFTCQLLLATAMVLSVALLGPVFQLDERGGLEETGSILLATAALSLLLLAAAAVRAWAGFSNRPALPPSALQADATEQSWGGLRVTLGAMVVAVILLVSYHFAVPLGIAGRVRLTMMIATGSAGLGATGAILYLGQCWGHRLADGAMGLLSLAVCGMVVSASPRFPDSLAERYPIVFNSMVFGWTAAMMGCVVLAARTGEATAFPAGPSLLERLRPHAQRFAFLNAVLALIVAGLMASWPRLRSIAVPDDSMARVTLGLAANLLLLLVLLWAARRLNSATFYVLTAFAVVSSAAFMMARMYPYAPRFR